MNTELRNKVLATAIAEIGVSEFPPNSNIVKYNDWFYGVGKYDSKAAWCGTFGSWVFDKSEANLGTIDYRKGYAGCQYAVAKVAKWGKIVSQPQPGDIVFFDWDGNGTFDHTGIFEKHIGDGLFSAIEGNTGIPKSGDPKEVHKANSNGGIVMRRTDRKYKQAIFIRPNVYKD